MKKIYFFLMAMMVAFAADAVDYYLIGGFNNWQTKDAKCLFTAQSDGTYVLDYEGTLSSGFKVNDGTWSNNDVNFGSNGSELVFGEPYSYAVGGMTGNINTSGNIENPHIVLDLNAATITVSGQVVASENVYAIKGNIFTGTTAWESKTMTLTNGKWVLNDVECSAGSFGVQQNDKATGAQTGWIFSGNGSAVTLNTAMACVAEGTGDGINWTLAAGTYSFSFDATAMTLTITGEGGGDDPQPGTSTLPEKLYLVGVATNWAVDEAMLMTKVDNVYTLNCMCPEGEWKIWDGTWDWSFGPGDVTAPEAGVAADAWFDTPSNFNLDETAFAGKEIIINFTAVEGSYVKDSSVPSIITITIDTSDVQEVAVAEGEAVYFNLQGQKVANPENGIYVKVVDGKASKVLVK